MLSVPYCRNHNDHMEAVARHLSGRSVVAFACSSHYDHLGLDEWLNATVQSRLLVHLPSDVTMIDLCLNFYPRLKRLQMIGHVIIVLLRVLR